MTDTLSPQEIAEKCSAVMLANDAASQGLGINIQAIEPGKAVLSMTVDETMLNGHKTCHGGFIFTLADSAFALACNSYNKTAVAAACDISFVRPAHAGNVLTADAREVHKAGRNGIYDIRITDQDNQTIALFRGKSRIISKTGPLDATKSA